MTQTQHPCRSCSLTACHSTHTHLYIYVYCLPDISASFPLCHLHPPLFFFTPFLPPSSRSFLLSPSLASSSPVPLTTSTVMIHVLNHRYFEGFSPHISLSLSPFLPPLSFSVPPSVPFSTSLSAQLVLLSFCESFAACEQGRICFYTSEREKGEPKYTREY